MTPRDLCTKGWRLDVGALERSSIVADGAVRAVGEITGVLNLLPYVAEDELVTIEPADRAYVSAELTALLFYFLNALTCPVVNRPSAECLTGPGWRHEQWLLACRQAGIPTGPLSAHAPCDADPGSEPMQSVTVLGREYVEGEDVPYAANVRALADLARVTFLRVTCAGEAGGFHSVQLTPHLDNPRHRAALSRFFGLG